jgi:hypothetical protein
MKGSLVVFFSEGFALTVNTCDISGWGASQAQIHQSRLTQRENVVLGLVIALTVLDLCKSMLMFEI